MPRFAIGIFSSVLLVATAYICCFCERPVSPADHSGKWLVAWNDLVVETMKTDGINPVLATRIYLYPNIASYEVVASGNPGLNPLSESLTDLAQAPAPSEAYDTIFASLTAYYTVMRRMNYREDRCDALYADQSDHFKARLKPAVYRASMAYGTAVGQHILAWAANDRYKETKGMAYFIPSEKPGRWKATPPEYRPALEAHWGALRPLILEDLDLYSRPFTMAYSEKPGSEFHTLAIQVYDTSKALTDDQLEMALFWDDNPDLNTFKGHDPTPRRHINPTAHWMSIIGQLVSREDKSYAETVAIYATAAIAFFEGNLVCWFDKYRSDLIRPVTYIREQVDSTWLPLLVTPPFPEHTSGHSVCSAACARVLSHFFGEAYAFTDSTHLNFNTGTVVRSFRSFDQATLEVSRSRFYGGIHYKTGIYAGYDQGTQVGDTILRRLKYE